MTLAPAKQVLRIAAKAALRAVAAAHRDAASRSIWARLTRTPEFQAAEKHGNVMLYLDFDNEVRTTCFLTRFSSVAVPYCEDGNIVPIRVFSPDELESGYRGISEPRADLARRPERRVAPADLSLVIVPGLAFDVQGNRLGRGEGYYDRFLARLPLETPVVALAFECQIVEQVPHDVQDRPVGLIVTENRRIFSRKSQKIQKNA